MHWAMPSKSLSWAGVIREGWTMNRSTSGSMTNATPTSRQRTSSPSTTMWVTVACVCLCLCGFLLVLPFCLFSDRFTNNDVCKATGSIVSKKINVPNWTNRFSIEIFNLQMQFYWATLLHCALHSTYLNGNRNRVFPRLTSNLSIPFTLFVFVC